ncbi:MAG: preprotein translocase subunit YajC [Actinomycetota bacterium]|nr:preprotein translocase subunit YajC [Actinomycetota bacterium]
MGDQSSLIFLMIFGIAFYLFLIRPQQMRQKQQQQMIAALRPGDRVVTVGGLYGTIVSIEGDTLGLRIADSVVVDVASAAVGRVVDRVATPIAEDEPTPGDDPAVLDESVEGHASGSTDEDG